MMKKMGAWPRGQEARSKKGRSKEGTKGGPVTPAGPGAPDADDPSRAARVELTAA